MPLPGMELLTVSRNSILYTLNSQDRVNRVRYFSEETDSGAISCTVWNVKLKIKDRKFLPGLRETLKK
jgi:hypothetical protein